MALPASDPFPFDLRPARDAATRLVDEGALPCAVIGVADGAGHQVVSAISGRRVSVGQDSVFFIASVTKAIVATALMRYVDEGRLDLHRPLAAYLPGLPLSGLETVSAWHLLTHTSGLSDIPLERLRSERPGYRRMLELTLDSTPRWEPGSRYEYNSSAWVLLSELMAQLSGLPFPDALRLRLTGPLDMAETVFDARPLRDRIVPVHGISANNRVVGEVLMWFLARATLPGGGMFSTAPDLLKLGRALLPSVDAATGARVLSHAAVTTMAQQQIEDVPHVAQDGTVSYMEQGIGWRRSGGAWPAGGSVITHGGVPGTRIWVDLDRDIVFVFLTNVWGASSDAAIAVLEEIYRARGPG